MSELEDRLNAVLSDPAELSRLTQMASQLMGSLGGGHGASSQAAPPPAEEATPAQETDPLSGLDLGAISAALGPMLKNMKPRKNPLVDAIAPYLDEGRRRKLERSMRIAAAARLAGGALHGLGENGHGL